MLLIFNINSDKYSFFLSVLFNDIVSCLDYMVSVIYKWMFIEWWNNGDKKTVVFREKPVPMPLHLPQIPH